MQVGETESAKKSDECDESSGIPADKLSKEENSDQQKCSSCEASFAAQEGAVAGFDRQSGRGPVVNGDATFLHGANPFDRWSRSS